MRILVQGFGPFGRFPINPSELLVRALANRATTSRATPGEDPPQTLGQHELHTEVLNTTAATVAEAVPALMAEHRPDVWLGVGLAAGRPSLSIEAVAVNLGCWETDDPEADREPWPRRPVSGGGPAAYLTSLPVEAILDAWRDAGLPGYLSHSAGTYLCNMSFYLAAEAAERLGTGCLVGFLHVPQLPGEVTSPSTEPSMSFALQQAGLDTVLDVCRATTRSTSNTSHTNPTNRNTNQASSFTNPVSTGRTG
jgi:pyroglutamyl-peptidase